MSDKRKERNTGITLSALVMTIIISNYPSRSKYLK